MLTFLLSIPEIVLYGCVGLILTTLSLGLWLYLQTKRVKAQVSELTNLLNTFGVLDKTQRRDGLSLGRLDELRLRCETLQGAPADWWRSIENHVEQYTSPEEKEGWFLTEPARQLLPYEVVIGKHFNATFFGAFPGLLTGAGLTLTFVAILISLYGVHYDKANTVDPISGIDLLINGLSGKFLSSIIALLLSIAFTLGEKRVIRSLRHQYEQLIAAASNSIPYLSSSRVLLDIQRFAAKQTVSVSHISSEVVDRLIGSFNSNVVPALAEGMSTGVAQKMESEFRPTMQRMNDTLAELKAALLGLEAQKQESVTGELRGFFDSLEKSMVNALSQMGDSFHSALTGAATQEFGNVQGTLEATRMMLSDMNTQFGLMQGAFAGIIEKAEQSTSDQMETGKEQIRALTALMDGLMVRMQESADQNLNSVRSQLTMVVGDLSEKVGTLSRDMMLAAENAAKQSQASADHVLEQTGNWSEATARRLEGLLANMEARSTEFQNAGQALMLARDFVAEVIRQNAHALDRMADASRQVQAYSTGLATQAETLKGIGQLHAQVTNNLKETSGSLRASSEQSERSLAEYRRSIEEYRRVIEEMDQSLGRILGALHNGLRDYNQSIENNFNEIVRIANPMISEASAFLHTQIEQLGGQLDELGSVISTSMERLNGRPK